VLKNSFLFCRQQGRRFDTLEQYANDFFRFIEGSESLFPSAVQRAGFRSFVKDVWQDLYLDPLRKRLNDKPNQAAAHANIIMEKLIREDHKLWVKDPVIKELGVAYGGSGSRCL
jgi:hypothetical protein